MPGEVSVRFSVQDAEVVRKALDDLGKDGETALKRFNAAGQATPGLKQVSDVVSNLKSSVLGLAVPLGPAGSLLLALGPAGVIAAVGIGALITAFIKLEEEANRIGDKARGLRDLGENIQLTAVQIQALQNAGAQLGVSTEDVAHFLQQFTVRVEELRSGSGKLYTELLKISPALADQMMRARSTTAEINLLAQAWAKASVEQRNALAVAAGGKGAFGFNQLLGAISGAGGLDGIVKQQSDSIVLSNEQTKQFALLKAQIDATNQHAKDLMATLFSEEVLQRELQAAQLFDRIAGRAKEMHDMSWSQWLTDFAVKVGQVLGGQQMVGAQPQPNENPERDRINREAQATIDYTEKLNKAWRDAVAPLAAMNDEIGKAASDLMSYGLTAQGALAVQQRINSAIGASITPLEQRRTEILRLAAIEGVSDSQRARGLAALDLAQSQTAIGVRERLALATQEQIVTAKLKQLQDDYAKGFIKNDAEMAQAERLIRKEAKDTADALAVRNSLLPGLTRLGQESGDLNKQLDQTGVALIGNVTSGMTDAAFSTDSLTGNLKKLEQQLARTALQMIINMTVGKALSTIFQGIFGMISPIGGGVLPGGLPLGKGGIGAAADGGSFGAGDWSIVGERGPELVRFGRDASVAPIHAVPYATSPGIASGAAGVSVNLNIKNQNGSDIQASPPKSDGRGGFDIDVIVSQLKKAVKTDMAGGGFDSVMAGRFGARRPTPAIG